MLRVAMLMAGLALNAEPDNTKHDLGTVKTADGTKNVLIVDTPAGQVTYDASNAQVFDAEGKPVGTASSLKGGDKVHVIYVVNNGAKVSEIRLLK